jgi:hypothetical protein
MHFNGEVFDLKKSYFLIDYSHSFSSIA